MTEYVDSCLTYTILLQDSGLLPKPTEDWITFIPEKGMYAYVDENCTTYIFNGTIWEEYIPEQNNLNEEEHNVN